jgi:hypothetical protein
MWLEIWDGLRTSTARVASLLRFAYFDMRSCGVAQLLSCSHLVDHTSIPLISHVNLMGRRSFLGTKHGFSCATLPQVL